MALHRLGTHEMNADVHAGVLPMDTLFIHGNLASNTWWEPSLEIWKREAKPGLEGRMIMAEWRGCGKSAAPRSENELHPATLADDYIALMRELNVKKACLVGHSTGGLIALYCLLKAPELFDRVVLLDSVAATGVQFEQAALDAFSQMSRDRAFTEVIMGATIHGNDAKSPFFQRLVDGTMGVAKEIWHGIPKALFGIDIRNELGKIEHPVLVLHGKHDVVLPAAGSLALAEGLANGRYQELEHQGHSANVENPGLFVKLVNDFLFNRP